MPFDLLSFLKGLIPEALIKTDSHDIHNEFHITLDRNFLDVGDSRIDDPEKIKKIMEAIGKSIQEAKEEDMLPFDIIHKDIFNSYSAMREALLDSSELILLGKALRREDMKVVFMAHSIHKKMFKEDAVGKRYEIMDLMNQLEKNFPENGKKVLNLMVAGYFDKLILPLLLELLKDKDRGIIQFNQTYQSMLKFFPTAIFVNKDTTNKKIIEETRKRIELKVPFIYIHALGENTKKVKEVLPNINSLAKMKIQSNPFKSPLGISGQDTKITLL